MGKRSWMTIMMTPMLAFTTARLATAADPPAVRWIRQIGTSDHDYGFGVAVDGSGNPYMTGYYGYYLDVFLRKYGPGGNLLWAATLGTDRADHSYGVALDGSGSAFIAGYTHGILGPSPAGGRDALVSKYGTTGELQWTRQLGTSLSDGATGVAVDASGNAFIGGYTRGSLGGPSAGYYDCFVSKYSSAGSLLWSAQAGTPEHEEGYGIAADGSGNCYLVGKTEGDLAGSNAGDWDAFLCKYDGDGKLLWANQIGTPKSDIANGVVADAAGYSYVTGATRGSLGGANQGDSDAFVLKYDPSGNLVWAAQLGTPKSDLGHGLALDSSGNIYLAGATTGSLGGPAAGDWDVFVSKYDSCANLLWTYQAGTSTYDFSWSVAVGPAGECYIAGFTEGSLGGPNAGGRDAVLISLVPEPATILLLALGAAGLPFWRRNGRP